MGKLEKSVGKRERDRKIQLKNDGFVHSLKVLEKGKGEKDTIKKMMDLCKGFDSYTTPSQQPHINPSHECGLQCVGSTLM
jgi:hypothetical protein